MVQDKSRWRPSLRRMFSSKEGVPQTEAKPSPSPISSGSSRRTASRSHSSSSSTDEDAKLVNQYTKYVPTHAAHDFVSMTPAKDPSELDIQPYRMTMRVGNCAGTSDVIRPLYLGHRDPTFDIQALITKAEAPTRPPRPKSIAPKKIGLPCTNKVMDEITARHHERVRMRMSMYGNGNA